MRIVIDTSTNKIEIASDSTQESILSKTWGQVY